MKIQQSLIEILATSGWLLRAHAVPLLAASFVLHGASDAISRAADDFELSDPELLIVLLASGVSGIFATVATCRYLSGTQRSSSPLALLPLVPPRLGTSVLLSLYLMSVFFVGTLLLIVPGLIAMAGFAVAAPVVAVEETAASRALLRSWELTRGRKRRAFALVAVTVLPMLGLGFLPAESVAIKLLVSAAYCTFATYADIATWLLYEDLRSNSLAPEDRDPASRRRAADVV